MKLRSSLLLVSFAVIVMSHHLNAQPASSRAAAGREVYGSVNGGIYTNKVIGIKLTVPKGLNVSEPQYVDVQLVGSQLPGTMFRQPLTVKSLVYASVPLTTFTITAAKLPANAANATGEQILNDPLFKGSASPVVKTEKLGTNTFAYIDGATRFNKQRSYAIVRRGYYISIVLGYGSPGDLDAMRQYLANADFDWKGN